MHARGWVIAFPVTFEPGNRTRATIKALPSPLNPARPYGRCTDGDAYSLNRSFYGYTKCLT